MIQQLLSANLEEFKMKRAACLAALVALVVIEVANTQETTEKTRICPRCDFVCLGNVRSNVISEGCPACGCPQTCKETLCQVGYRCEMSSCTPAGCPKTHPMCVPIVLCLATPNKTHCDNSTKRWEYKKSSGACEKFDYYGCTPSYNTYTSKKACEERCVSPHICGQCADDCYTFNNNGNRSKCVCPNPCKKLSCKSDEVCKVKDLTCDKGPCKGTAYCAKNAPHSCPIQPPKCTPALDCKYGYAMNDIGCEICKCCDKPDD